MIYHIVTSRLAFVLRSSGIVKAGTLRQARHSETIKVARAASAIPTEDLVQPAKGAFSNVGTAAGKKSGLGKIMHHPCKVQKGSLMITLPLCLFPLRELQR